MNRENAGSAASSGATSNKQPPPQKKPDPDKDKPKSSEAQYLLDQQTQAKAAMDRVVQDMKAAFSNGIKDNAHLTEWLGAYPWISLGGSAVLGFLTASALTPAREESFKERLRSLMKETEEKEVDLTEKPAAKEKGTERAAKAAVKAQKPSYMESLASGLFDIVKTALVSTLSGAVAGKVADSNEEPKSGNGHESATSGGAY
jgi:hypothetical protein